MTLSGNTFNHTNSITAGTASGTATSALGYSGTFDIPSVTYDAQGHITGKGVTTITLPAAQSIGNGALTLNTSGSGISGSASFTANQAGATTFTVTSNATAVATASTISLRNTDGNIVTKDEIVATNFSLRYDSTSRSVKFVFA